MCNTIVQVPVHPTSNQQKTSIIIRNSLNKKFSKKKLNFICGGIILVSILFLSAVVSLILILGIKPNKNNNIIFDIVGDTNINNKTSSGPLELSILENNTIDNVKMYRKTDWPSIKDNEGLLPLEHPIKLIIFCHTSGRFCQTHENCSNVVSLIQKFNIFTLKLPDIKYNFLIGGDGNIYEGRGWHFQNNLTNNSISVGLIGNYVYDSLTVKMLNAVEKLFELGVSSGVLDENYKILCHNQTDTTISPGPRAYKLIKNLPHYSSELIIK